MSVSSTKKTEKRSHAVDSKGHQHELRRRLGGM